MIFFEGVFDGRRVEARLRRGSGYAAQASDIRQHIPADYFNTLPSLLGQPGIDCRQALFAHRDAVADAGHRGVGIATRGRRQMRLGIGFELGDHRRLAGCGSQAREVAAARAGVDAGVDLLQVASAKSKASSGCARDTRLIMAGLLVTPGSSVSARSSARLARVWSLVEASKSYSWLRISGVFSAWASACNWSQVAASACWATTARMVRRSAAGSACVSW